MRLLTANVNGIRAAQRRGGITWLEQANADVLTLQEVRATPDQLASALAQSELEPLYRTHAPAAELGRAGVAVLSRVEPLQTRIGLGDNRFDELGRWVEAVLPTDRGPVTVVSAYLISGGVGTPAQDDKFALLEAVDARIDQALRSGEDFVLTGDLNIAHTEADLKNWKGNLGKAGFLPRERAHLDRWLEPGRLHDVHRRLAGPGPGPYTWWSWRGKAFDNDSGWRIDYQFATGALAATARSAYVGRAREYAQRWSDHAAVVVDYDVVPVAANRLVSTQ